ncbi:receptor-like serine/threonine-protein kinase At2g45590 [Cajanus cajan]|uniref:receptor-like serine/threonine-protein kinase At2g45590 n=1 Tax=Cajanus cajan TaxID=3821 RepID=UPI00098D7D43|nr:receptor-like serine/threonine-protein kinase At2g45590 [Cajanus cajan]
MPSRQLATSGGGWKKQGGLLGSTSSALACSFFLLILLCLRKRKRTTPSSDADSNPPHPYPYPLLRRATNSFSTRLGQGGFGPVFSGTLGGQPVAVKLMDSASLQGEREFHNELLLASRLRSPLVLPAIGFSSDPKRRRFLLVYQLMPNGNLHDALLRRRSPHLTPWKNRFHIILHVARAIHYLHSLQPPVIHGDIKPSNILLDHSFSAKLADFGLARFKTHTLHPNKDESESDAPSESDFETQSVNTDQSFDDTAKGDYVRDWIASSSGTVEKKKSRRKLGWWESMEGHGLKKDKRRPAREWWKEEYSEELAKKKKKKKKKGDMDNEEDVGVYKNRSGVESWLSGERWNSYESAEMAGKSGGVSSSRSMRGTILYVAPECGYSGEVSEKSDVYSLGVLLLVIVSGRRPLQVTGSPISEFRRANLVSWAKQCARKGKVLEVVDESVEGLDKEQAILCVTVALMCLLNSPARRPSMEEVLGMLTRHIQTPPQEHGSQTISMSNYSQQRRTSSQRIQF